MRTIRDLHRLRMSALLGACLGIGLPVVAWGQCYSPPSNSLSSGTSPGHVAVWQTYYLGFTAINSDDPSITFLRHELNSKIDNNAWEYKDYKTTLTANWSVVNQDEATVKWQDVAVFADASHWQMIGVAYTTGDYISP